jgi:hypothetical protein
MNFGKLQWIQLNIFENAIIQIIKLETVIITIITELLIIIQIIISNDE